jgi:enoyl-CoA hydratase/carnithine racemase
MSLVKSEIKDDIAIIYLNNGVTNPINTDFCKDFINTLSKVKEMDNLKGLILTSASTKFFSIGFDIPTLLTCDRSGINEFYDVFNELCEVLFTIPLYTISAITGHYVAGGTLIAACTDVRIVVQGRAKTGITAIKLGLSVPLLGHLIVKSRMKSEYADEFLRTGDFYEIPWVQKSGYLDKLTTQEELLSDAIEFVKKKETKQLPEFIREKQQTARSIVEEYKKNHDQDRTKFTDSWFDPGVQKNLKDAVKKY